MREDRIIQLYTKCKSNGTNYRYNFIKYKSDKVAAWHNNKHVATFFREGGF